MKYVGEVFQDRKRDFLNHRNYYVKAKQIEPDIIFIGDSITEGFNFTYAGVTDKIILNSGVSGDRLVNLHYRLMEDAISLNPEKIVVMLGINDILSEELNVDEYQEKIQQLYNKYILTIKTVKNENIEPICCGIIKISQTKYNCLVINHQIDNFNNLIKEFCKLNGFTFIDYNQVLLDKYGDINPTYFIDGLHPNEKGYFKMFCLLNKSGIL